MDHVQNRLVIAVFEQLGTLTEENYALRRILRRQGLSDATIQRRVAAALKRPKDHPSALDLLRQVCEEILKNLGDFDLAVALAAKQIKGKPQ
jgi:cation transport ATPase